MTDEGEVGDQCNSMFETCFSKSYVMNLIASSTLAVLIGTILMGHLFQGKPLKQLGRRPLGYGFVTYLCRSYLDGVGTWGYDPVLGSMSMPIRMRCHMICWGIVTWVFVGIWPDSLLFPSTSLVGSSSLSTLLSSYIPETISPLLSFVNEDCWFALVPNQILFVIGIATIVYWSWIYVVHHVMESVSYPGGPREHKIRRMPKWNNKQWILGKKQEDWRCCVAEDSHTVTMDQFGAGTTDPSCKAKLTGEPVGRQIWTTQPRRKQETKEEDPVIVVDEALVQKMACGGRSYDGFNPSINPNGCDSLFRAQMIRNYIASGKNPPPMKEEKNDDGKEQPKPKQSISKAIYKAGHFYSMLQTEDGHWGGDYGGPHFLMPGLIVVWYVMGKPKQIIDERKCELMKHYILAHQQCDGGWGTHIESPSTMFGSVIMYVALRLLIGHIDTDDSTTTTITKEEREAIRLGQEFIAKYGGALMTSSWSKFYLCLLGCMDWNGHNSVPPEMWMLPNWIPFHPGRMWCHARMVYLPMGYLYGRRFVYKHAENDPLILSLRKELYPNTSYEDIDWFHTRHFVADMDNYTPIPWTMKFIQNALAYYETVSIVQPFKNLVRNWGLRFSMEYIYAEDLQTNFIDIGPVNKVLNMLSVYDYVDGNVHHEKIQNHMMRVADYLWVAEDGMKMQGYNGSQCWDTSFAIQAYYEAKLLDEFPELSTRVYQYLERTQILSTETSQASPAYTYETNDYRKQFYRHVSQGGWPFSTSAHGWPISDCTGEGLKGVLALLSSSSSMGGSQAVRDGIQNGSLNLIDQKRLQDAVHVLLTYQNEDGGWATYENNRGFRWYEQLNPSEAFGDIMIDYSYVECSMASLTALVEYKNRYPKDPLCREIQYAIDNGKEFMKRIQRPDGSWYGSWACCFCYGCWFGIEGLVKCGETLETCTAILRCVDFLLRHQRPNGGWGEDFTSCYDKDYARDGMAAYGDDGSGVVNTSWALLALSEAKCTDTMAIRRGVRFLIQTQLPSGDWPQEGISGVFNRACGITYTAYRNVFPLWALGRCKHTYGEELFDTE